MRRIWSSSGPGSWLVHVGTGHALLSAVLATACCTAIAKCDHRRLAQSDAAALRRAGGARTRRARGAGARFSAASDLSAQDQELLRASRVEFWVRQLRGVGQPVQWDQGHLGPQPPWPLAPMPAPKLWPATRGALRAGRQGHGRSAAARRGPAAVRADRQREAEPSTESNLHGMWLHLIFFLRAFMPARKCPQSPKPGATAKFSRCRAPSRLRAAEGDGWAPRSRTRSKEGLSLGPGCGAAGHGRPSAVLATSSWTIHSGAPLPVTHGAEFPAPPVDLIF